MLESPILSATNLTKVYDLGQEQVHALAGVSLTIQQGEFVAIMGPSGSGKSTFMNLLGCLDVPSSGDLILQNQNVADLNNDELAIIRNRNIGFVFQQFNLLARTSALANVEVPLIYAGVNAEERHERAAQALERVGLGNRMDHMPNQLSGGQQQRVAIARALVNNPSLILADEPTGALDTHTGEDIMNLFSELNKSGMTIVLVTHEAEIAAYAKRSVTFRDGVIVSDTANGASS